MRTHDWNATPMREARKRKARIGTPERGGATVLRLQRTIGNAAATRVLQRDDDGGPAPATPATKHSASTLDAKAEAIVKAAQDTSKPVAERAIQVVRSIIDTYFSADAGLVKDIVFDDAERKGLNTTAGTGKDAKGTIAVGPAFLSQTTDAGFARRVIQVDHELEHVRQHRAGLGGAKNKVLREFLAFYRESLEPELAGTGRVAHGTRIDLIDEALRNYYALSADAQKTHEAKKTELLAERERHNGKGGHPKTDPPTGP